MATIELPPNVSAATANGALESFAEFTRRYHADAAFRAAVEADPKEQVANVGGLSFPAGADVEVVANTDDVMYIALPPDPNAELSDETLSAVAGGSGSLSTSACAPCLPSTQQCMGGCISCL